MEKKGYQSWTISDELWDAIKGQVPTTQRDPNKVYKRKPGAGRKPLEPRRVLEGIFYVLRTGCQWKAVPEKYGCGSSIHRYFQEWCETGFFEKNWALGLEKYDELEGIGWQWQSVDGCMVKAPLAREAAGRNPTDRGKNGHKKEYIDGAEGSSLVCGGGRS